MSACIGPTRGGTPQAVTACLLLPGHRVRKISEKNRRFASPTWTLADGGNCAQAISMEAAPRQGLGRSLTMQANAPGFVATQDAIGRLIPTCENLGAAHRQLLTLAAIGRIEGVTTALTYRVKSNRKFLANVERKEAKYDVRIPTDFWSEIAKSYSRDRSSTSIDWDHGDFKCEYRLDEFSRIVTCHLSAEAVMFSTDGLPASPSAPAGIAVAAKSGRKPLPIWDKIWCEICRRLYHEGRWSSRADAVRYLQEWCQEQGLEPPNDSAMKLRVSQFWRVLDLDGEPAAD